MAGNDLHLNHDHCAYAPPWMFWPNSERNREREREQESQSNFLRLLCLKKSYPTSAAAGAQGHTQKKCMYIYILYNIKEMEIEKEKKSQRRNKMKIHFLQWTRWDVEPNQRKGWLTTHKHHILVRETQRKSPCTQQEWSGTKRNPLMRSWRPRRRAREKKKEPR